MASTYKDKTVHTTRSNRVRMTYRVWSRSKTRIYMHTVNEKASWGDLPGLVPARLGEPYRPPGHSAYVKI